MANRSLPALLLPQLVASLAIVIFFFSATQLGLHFWPQSAFLYGLRLDYLSPTLYFLDLLIVFYLFLRYLDRKSQNFANSLAVKGSDPIGIIFPILLVNLLFSLNPLATLSWSLHLCLYFAFLSSLSFLQIKRSLFIALPLTLLFQTLLSFLQVFRGRSFQGIFYLFGERSLSLASPNVAKGEFFGKMILRAYGTFSHPNALAGWSIITLLIILQLRRQRQSLVGLTLKNSSAISARKDPKRSDPMGIQVVWFVTIITSILVFLTQSRSAGLTLFGFVIPFFLLRSLRLRALYFSLFFLVGYFLLTTGFYPQRRSSSVSERLAFQQTSLSSIKAWPIFGTGTNASLSGYPLVAPNLRLLQPDHNSITLFLSWFGLFGTIATIYLARSLHFSKRSSHPDLIWRGVRSQIASGLPLLPLFPLLILDHYLLTSPQGLFIFLLYLRVSYFAKLKLHENANKH